MRILASTLALALAAPVRAEAPGVSASTPTAAGLPTVIITAPGVRGERVRRLKQARAAGGAAAAGGLGMMAYAVLAGAGPIGWAAALLFFGGMTAYLSHRRLEGEGDFRPGAVPAPAAPPAPEAGQDDEK